MLAADDRGHLPVADRERRQQVGRAVAHVLELAAGRPGATGWLGAAGRRTPMPVFSSTQKVGPSVGGCSSRSMIATALAANSGSRSSIQESKPLQTDVSRLEDLAHRALAGTTNAHLGMLTHIPRQIPYRPVGLP